MSGRATARGGLPNGFTANVALAFTNSQNTRTVEEYDRAPTMWVLNNNSRP